VVTEASRLIKTAIPTITSIRLNTNGLFAEADATVEELKASGITDCSVALNYPNATAYNEVMLHPPSYDTPYHVDCVGDVSGIGEDGFLLATNFIRALAASGINTVVTCVEHSEDQTKAVEQLAMDLGASSFKRRSYVPSVAAPSL
jgi:hypothetical protein